MHRGYPAVDLERCGAGGIRSRFRIRRTVEAPTRYPRPSSSPWIRLYPQPGFSRAICSISTTSLASRGGRPPNKRIGPAPADQPPMPAQQRVRRDQPAHPQRPGEKPDQGGEDRAVCPVQLRPGVLPPQHGDLVAQHQQLGVLRRRRACQLRHPARQADEHQVKHPYRHKPAMLPAHDQQRRRTRRSAFYAPFWNPTGTSRGWCRYATGSPIRRSGVGRTARGRFSPERAVVRAPVSPGCGPWENLVYPDGRLRSRRTRYSFVWLALRLSSGSRPPIFARIWSRVSQE